MNRCLLLIQLLVICLSLGLLIGAAAAQNEAAKMFQGAWQASMGEPKNKMYDLTIDAEKISAKSVKDGKVVGEGTYKLDPAKKTIDVVGTGGEYKGKTFRGLYDFEGKTLKWCTGNANQARPPKVAHEPGKGSYLLILQPRP